MSTIIHNFKIIKPQFLELQAHSLKWITQAHAYVKTMYQNSLTEEKNLQENTMERMTERFCCTADKIMQRGFEIRDFCHFDFSQMDIFNIIQSPQGAPLSARMKFFEQSVDRVFEELYKDIQIPPSELIHVTCTGYVSPSPAQKLISKKDWGHLCQATHAYHMGCYASIPALRMAQGFLSAPYNSNNNDNRVDVVHTELCTLHFNPYFHTPEQFVIQSLFADGFISYSVSRGNKMHSDKNKHAFEILALREEIFRECHDAMTWNISEFGFSMTISRTVPTLIAMNIQKFLNTLFQQAGLSFTQEKNDVLFAIHPGGPKIIENIAEVLNLSQEKVETSKKILKHHGNMSSATLPHIWEDISLSNVNKNSLVVSLAFGPGLTVAGSLMRIV
jgi:predicted naringenin-chalcone synthase